MSAPIERIQYIKAGEDRIMIIDSRSRRLIADSSARTSEARVASWRKSDRILKDENMDSLPGVSEFRASKTLELNVFLESKPSLSDLIEFAERVRDESMEFFDSLARSEARGITHRREKDPKEQLILSAFFDVSQPCNFDGCEGLRAEWLEAYEEAGGDDCTGCQMGALRRQFEKRVLELTDAKSV